MTLCYYHSVALSLYLLLSNMSSERPNQGESRRSKSRPSAPSRPRDRPPEVQPADGSSAGIPAVAARGNAPTIPARSSRSKHTPERGAGIGALQFLSLQLELPRENPGNE